MVIARYPYRPLTKLLFSSPEIYGNILNIIWGGIKTTKFLFKYIDRPEDVLYNRKLRSATASILYWEYLKMV